MANDTEDQWQEESTLSLTATQQKDFWHTGNIIFGAKSSPAHYQKNNLEGLGTGRRKDDEKFDVAFRNEILSNLSQLILMTFIHSTRKRLNKSQ